jgi:hypothetical protein
MQKEDLRVWRAAMWMIWVLALLVAFLTLIAQLGETLMRLVKAWRPILF